MIVVLAAGVTALEEQIHEQLDLSANTALLGIPKALLPLSGKSSLSWWWQLILQQHQQIPPLVYIVASPQRDAFIDTLSVALRVAWSSNPSDTITPSSKRSIESATLSPTCNSGQEEIFPLTILGSDFLPDKLLLDSWSTRPDEASVLVSPDGVYLLAIKMDLIYHHLNFWASVTLLPNKDTLDPSVLFVANAMCDYTVFGSIQTAHRVAQIDGYDGATRLLLATLRVFVQYCLDNGITLNRCGMRIVYQTNIPRQVGLAGSSALVTSLIKCLVRFYDISDSLFPLWAQANLALSAERDELGIAAGLQDRVVQAYGGCVHMNFDQHLMTSRGYGEYQILDTASIPLNIWMAYVRQPKESGQVHHTVKQRFESGDQEVVQGMQYLGGLAHQAQLAMISGDTPALARLFDDNFALRRKLYGDEVIGAQTLKIVDLAHMHGHAAKLSGSGGCVIGLWRDADLTAFVDRTRKLQLEIEREGFIFCFVDVPRN
ncbi:hypothetical protein BSLG_005408 [Batrachochytrium salamandrivorans]|nr:hypothetical protein BSLG_005408 [Batrachochytrium salamandrivorans]